jgi:antirestriction protein ArdC
MDDLALLEVHELDQMQNRFKDQIRYMRRQGHDTSHAEVELSYVQRELEIREQREKFAENLRREGYQFEECV